MIDRIYESLFGDAVLLDLLEELLGVRVGLEVGANRADHVIN